MNASNIELDPEEKQKRIDRIMEHTKEEIATQWVTLGSDMMTINGCRLLHSILSGYIDILMFTR